MTSLQSAGAARGDDREGRRPTSTSPRASAPSCASTATSSTARVDRGADPQGHARRWPTRSSPRTRRSGFETEDELDFSFGIQNLARFRGNVFKQRGCVAMVIRMIPFKIRTFEELGLPPIVAKLAERPRGLVLVTGPTGLGQVDHARRDDRQDQPGAEGPHHHGRRPDRVHPPPPELHRQPARDRDRHQELRQRAQVRAARGPRRHPGR